MDKMIEWLTKKNFPSHYLFGIITVLSSILSNMFPLVCVIGFLGYELNEDTHINDKAYPDIREYLIGVAITIGVLIVLRFLGRI